jgi:dihydroorotate dehydrogenase subfamily 1
MEKGSVVITGVSSGIGWGTTRVLIDAGYRVFGSVRKQEDADRLQEEFGEAYVPLLFDVTVRSQIDEAAQVVAAVRRATRLPVIAKLTPNVTDITEIAVAVESAGADAVSLINTLVGMAVDLERRRPVLANVTGGLSGPAVKPVALAMVWKVFRSVRVPVIGLGGIASARDALEFIVAGASAVQVGTASFVDPAAGVHIARGIEAYCRAAGVDRLAALVGTLET